MTAADDVEGIVERLENGAQPDPQLIISDYRLEGSAAGIDVIRTLRERFGADLPAVLISGDTGPETLGLAQRAGLPLLHKPVRPARLRALLNRLPDKD